MKTELKADNEEPPTVNTSDRRTSLRKFGLVMTVPFAALGTFGLWRGSMLGIALLTVAAAFVASALIRPSLLGPVERGWLAVARILSIVSTFVLLSIAFLIVVTPMGLIMRLFGRDLLEKRIDPRKRTYWKPVSEDGPCTRPMKPY